MIDCLPTLLALSQAQPIDEGDKAFLDWIGRLALQELEELLAHNLANPGFPATRSPEVTA